MGVLQGRVLVFQEALRKRGSQAGQRGEDLRHGLVQTRTVAWTTELFAVPCRAWRPSGPDGHLKHLVQDVLVCQES